MVCVGRNLTLFFCLLSWAFCVILTVCSSFLQGKPFSAMLYVCECFLGKKKCLCISIDLNSFFLNVLRAFVLTVCRVNLMCL